MRFRILLAALVAAIPIEAVGLFLLTFAPHVGAPQNPRLWLRFAGDMAVLVHMPWLILTDFLCAKFCPPSIVLQIVIAAGGYVDVLLLMWFFNAVVQMWKPEARS